jgi:hypothetical protein
MSKTAYGNVVGIVTEIWRIGSDESSTERQTLVLSNYMESYNVVSTPDITQTNEIRVSLDGYGIRMNVGSRLLKREQPVTGFEAYWVPSSTLTVVSKMSILIRIGAVCLFKYEIKMHLCHMSQIASIHIKHWNTIQNSL